MKTAFLFFLGWFVIPAVSATVAMRMDLNHSIDFRGHYWGLGLFSGMMAGALITYSILVQI